MLISRLVGFVSSHEISSQYLKKNMCVLKHLFLRQCSSEVKTEEIAIPLRTKKKKSEIIRDSSFVDWCRVKITAGKGGDGCISFLHLWCNPNAGPDGGDGGHGGHVIFEAKSNVKSLKNVNSLYRGLPGEKGRSCHMHGANADHTIIEVPVGTTVLDENGNIVVDLDSDEDKFIAARGGAGGKGNGFFLSNKNRHPRIAELGAEGESKIYSLELKLLAHAGLVGFPNAGKSTLLQAISRARPKVASYPFTTLNPHIGIIHYDDYEQLAVADLPGLIPGAHLNKGLGFSFLRHIQRCICVLYVIDLSENKPTKQLDALKYELEQYKTGLSLKPHAIVANKIDKLEAKENLLSLQESTDLPIFPVSAKYGKGLTKLLYHLRSMYDKHNEGKLNW
ncbi:mitochondrial ribosome-associated GTPase 2 [Centruroides vittatus]|uniref:mitochondrial ribosome-associated GTPase 2 n=1 Tax=Centruroides vittatus TaxID=120091 RepID=UPI0035104382